MRIGGLFRDLFVILSEQNDVYLESHIVDKTRPTVVFVSGFGSPQKSLRVLRKRFIRDGFNVTIFSLHWQDLQGSVVEMAKRLANEVLSIKKRAPETYVHLVAHSAGGIVARYYVQQLGGSYYCETLTTLATPHQGSWLSLLGFFSKLAFFGRWLFELSPRSRLIHALNILPMPQDIRMVSVFSRDDWVCGKTATQLPESLKRASNVKAIEVGGISHSDFILTKRGYMIVSKILNGWTQRSPDDIFAAINS